MKKKKKITDVMPFYLSILVKGSKKLNENNDFEM